MGLTEEEFTKIVEGGCPSCKSEELTLRAYVPARFLLLSGEAYGPPRFTYKGEELAKGTFRAECVNCKHRVYESNACPKCGASALDHALDTPDAHAPTRPKECPRCKDEQVTYVAWLPVMIKVHAARPDKARTLTSLDDEGCHGTQVECKDCLYQEALKVPGCCSLCGSPTATN